MRYQVYSYGDPSAPRGDQHDHGAFVDRDVAEERCRDLVITHGRRSAHVMRNSDGTLVYYFDQDEPFPDPDVELTIDVAEQILRKATSEGSRFLRALIDEGGTARAERLKDLTGATKLGPMMMSLNTACRYVLGYLGTSRRQSWRLVESRDNPDRQAGLGVYEYTIRQERVPVFDEALQRLGR